MFKNIDIELQIARFDARRSPNMFVLLSQSSAPFAADWMEANNTEEIELVRRNGLTMFKYIN